MYDAAEILGVKQGATEEEIRKAFRQKSKEAHPDVGGSAEAFSRLQLACDTLLGKETPPDNSMGIISQLYHSMISQLGTEIIYVDVVTEMKNHFIQQIEKVNSNIATQKAQINLFEQLNTRCDTGSILHSINIGSIGGLQHNIKNHKRTITELQACVDLLEQASFRPEPRVQTTFTMQNQWYRM